MCLARYCIMLSLRDVACLLELLVTSVGMSAADKNTTTIKMIIGVTMKNSVGRLRIRPEQRVVSEVFRLLLPMEMSAGYASLSPPTRDSVKS
mmetsp:Transcript_34780/g.71005  ORF Transcript_34780/g.71005 Transcript_34780/m.71005 type:complete len:92 (-) Transcript_34780:126-401(-)